MSFKSIHVDSYKNLIGGYVVMDMSYEVPVAFCPTQYFADEIARLLNDALFNGRVFYDGTNKSSQR